MSAPSVKRPHRKSSRRRYASLARSAGVKQLLADGKFKKDVSASAKATRALSITQAELYQQIDDHGIQKQLDSRTTVSADIVKTAYSDFLVDKKDKASCSKYIQKVVDAFDATYAEADAAAAAANKKKRKAQAEGEEKTTKKKAKVASPATAAVDSE